jgi:hypothetical protein
LGQAVPPLIIEFPLFLGHLNQNSGLNGADAPRGRHDKEAVRELHAYDDEQLAAQWFDEPIRDMNDPPWPIEVAHLVEP